MLSTLDPIIINLLYALVGGLMTLLFMWLGCRLFNRLVAFDIAEQLRAGNLAVGMMVAGIFIGIGVAMGLVVGLGLN